MQFFVFCSLLALALLWIVLRRHPCPASTCRSSNNRLKLLRLTAILAPQHIGDFATPLSELERTNTTNPNDTEANAAGRRGVRVRSAKGTCENQGAWVAKSLAKSEALVGDAHSGNA
jgi:hypothetical protein